MSEPYGGGPGQPQDRPPSPDPRSQSPAYQQPQYPPQYQSGYGYPPAPPAGSTSQQAKGFFGSLFDFSFTSFVTPKIVKFVYVLATVVLALAYLAFVVASFAESAAAGIVVLILGAVGVIVYLAFVRMTLEFYYAVVRMSEDINRRLPPG